MKLNRSFAIVTIGVLICSPELSISQPHINIQPDHLDFDDWREAGEVQERELTISNDGDEDLIWHGDINILREPDGRVPRRDEPGDLLDRFRKNPNEHVTPVGYDPDNEWMWVTYTNDETVSALADDFREQMRLNVGPCIDGAWAKGFLYLPRFNSNLVYRYNAAGQNVGTVEMPFPIVGMAADDEEGWLFLMSAEDTAIHVFTLEDDGGINEEIGIINNHLEYHNNSDTFGFEWVHKHPDGQLWMVAPNTGRVHQISLDTNNWQCNADRVNFVVFPNDEEPMETTICHDGHNIWAGGIFEDDVRIYDDGVTEAYWLMVGGLDGVVEPQENQAVWVVFSAIDLLAGEYRAVIHIVSNDPANAEVDIMVSAYIAGAPDLSVEWPEMLGFPDIIDFNMRYVEGIDLRVSYSIPLVFRNVGTDDLEIMEITTRSQRFSVNFQDGIILVPGEWVEIELSFLTEDQGEWDEALWITSNSDGAEEISIPLHASTLPPPRIAIDPEEIRQVLDWRESAEQILTLANDGESDLRWLAEIEPVPIRDESNEVVVTIDPSIGVVEAGASIDLVLFMQFIESDSIPDLFIARFSSNDPANPEVIIPIAIQTLEVGNSESTLLPTATKLLSLYPNPFNNSTTISFAIGALREAPLRLAVYGVDGRLVENIVTGKNAYPPGYHSVVWNAEGIPAGSYLVRFEADDGAVQEQWVRLVK